MRNLLRDLVDGFRHPEFWALSAWLDIIVKYRRSRLGLLWLISPSVVYVGGVGALFAGLMGQSIRSFAAHVALGWIVFRLVSSVTTESTNVLFGARAFIMDGHMRLSDFVLRAIAKACFYFAMSLPVAIVALAFYPHVHWMGLLVALLALVLVLVNALWVGVVFSLAGARFPDLSQFIGNIFMFLFLLTPIVWYPDRVPASSVRGMMMRSNPFYHLIEIVRAPVLGEPISHATWLYVAVMTVVGWSIAIVAYRRYARFVPIWL
jgi:ABC-type polysaccharide/polyol phosphate export permease